MNTNSNGKRQIKKRRVIESGPEGAKRAAITLLAHKEQTEKELLSKLVERGFSKEDARRAVEFTIEKGYLSEQRYFLRFVDFYGRAKHFGRRRIMQEAKRKGFSEKTIELYAEDALSALDFDMGCFEALKKLGARACRQKLTAALLRRGFSVSNVRFAFCRYEEEIGPLGDSGQSEELLFEDEE